MTLRSPASRTTLLLIAAAVFLFPLLAYFGTAESIVAIWNRSGTFAHGYVIVPISLWLLWQRRATLATLPVRPYWPALGLLLLCGLAWLLGALGEMQIVRQYALVAMLPVSALALLGVAMARAMAFPLLFLLFGVPFGEVFVAPLIDVTANFTVDALRLTGIPVFRDGNNFTIPSGNWSVVEACSGVRYLISSVTLGTLYAYLTYRSLRRRLLFVLLATIVPIIANGLRAYMIVMMGHLSGMTMAVGFDHLIYGWVFFGIVMFVLFWLGSYWREDGTPEPAAPEASATPALAPGATLAGAAALIVLCLGVWPAYAAWLERAQPAAGAPQLASFGAAAADGAAFTSWKPSFLPASAELRQFSGMPPVGVQLLFYRNAANGAKLISSSNTLTNSHDWHEVGGARREETIGARGLALRESTVVGAGQRLLVWRWYWIDGSTTPSDVVGKALQLRQKLQHGSDDGAAVMVFAPYTERPDEARAALRAYLAGNLAALDAMLARTRQP